jgi:hypothetical protein
MSTVNNNRPTQNATLTRPPVQQQVMPQDNTRVANPPRVNLDSSNLSVGAEKTNPFSSFAPSSSSVTVDGWKKGKNDSLEGILKNQGYSLSEIYSKDANGKTLVDKVASANNLRNPNVIHPGQELNVPSKEKSESVSSMDLGNGQFQSASVDTGDVSIDTKMSKDKQGNIAAQTTANAGDASIGSTTDAPAGGRADTAVFQEGDSVKAQTVAMNGNGSSVSQVDTQTRPGASNVTVSDIDSNRGLDVSADNNNVQVTNNGSGGAVTTNVDISESSSDGWFENAGRSVTNWFTGNQQTNNTVSTNGASSVSASKNDEGQATVTARVDGKNKTLLETAGDTDDSWLERSGESVDGFFQGIGNWFNGGESTDKSAVYKQTSRGRRPV